MCYFLLILKIAMSAKRSVIIHQTSAFAILLAEIILYYSAIYVGESARFGFVPRFRYPRNATDTHTLVFERCVIIKEISKPSFSSSQSRKDERIAKSAFPQRQQVSLLAFFSHYMLNAKEGICESH